MTCCNLASGSCLGYYENVALLIMLNNCDPKARSCSPSTPILPMSIKPQSGQDCCSWQELCCLALILPAATTFFSGDKWNLNWRRWRGYKRSKPCAVPPGTTSCNYMSDNYAVFIGDVFCLKHPMKNIAPSEFVHQTFGKSSDSVIGLPWHWTCNRSWWWVQERESLRFYLCLNPAKKTGLLESTGVQSAYTCGGKYWWSHSRYSRVWKYVRFFEHNAQNKHLPAIYSPHLCVCGSWFWLCIPALSSHTTNSLTQLPHNQLSHTHTTPSHTTYSHTTYSHNSLTHNSFTHNFLTHTHTLTHNLLTHSILTHTHTTCSHTTPSHTTYSHTTYSHATLSHTTLSHTTLSHTTYSHTTLSHTTLSHNSLTHNFSHTQLAHTQLSHTQLNLLWRHRPSLCVAGVGLGDADLHFVWQARTWRHRRALHGRRRLWHWAGSGGPVGSRWRRSTLCGGRRLATSTFTLCGWRGTWWHRPSFCVAGVALGDIDLQFVWKVWQVRHRARSSGALGSRWRRSTLWQAWHLATSTFTLCGTRGTWWHRPALCMKGVARTALGWLWWRAYGTRLALVVRLLPANNAHVVWHVWHFWHWAGPGGALGSPWRRSILCGWWPVGFWWRAWFPVTPLHFVWQAWHLATPTFTLCGRWHRPAICMKGVALTARGWLPLVARLVPGDALCGRRDTWWHVDVGFTLCGRRGTWWHRPALCVACVALGDIGVHFEWQAWHLWHGALSHTTLSRTISLPPSPRYSHTLSHTHTQLSHTQPFHTHTQLSRTQLTPTALSHTALSYVPLSHNLSSTISTQLTHTFSDTTCGARNLLKRNSLTRNSHTYLFHTICLPPSPQNSLLLFSNTWDKPSHTQPSHTELHSICLPPSPFSFLPFPSRLHLAFATYWKTWHVGLSGPLTVFALTFDRNMKQQWENLPGIPKSCMQSSLRLDKDLSFSTCNQWTHWVAKRSKGLKLRWSWLTHGEVAPLEALRSNFWRCPKSQV